MPLSNEEMFMLSGGLVVGSLATAEIPAEESKMVASMNQAKSRRFGGPLDPE